MRRLTATRPGTALACPLIASWLVAFVGSIGIVACSPVATERATPPSAPSIEDGRVPDRATLAGAIDARVDALMTAEDGDVEIGLWLGPPQGPAWYTIDADVARPAASSIKTAYLVELFDAFEASLDEPLPGASAVVDDASHPAVIHFDEGVRATIGEHLRSATVRRVGEMMIRGEAVPNEVYNAAANVTTAVLGGPDGITRRIHDRDPDFSGLVARRYMLAARDVTGDNEATPASLAAVMQRIASGNLDGVSSRTLVALRGVLGVPQPPIQGGVRGAHFHKGGSLDSDPPARILSGFWETDSGTIVYTVMAERPSPGTMERSEAGDRLMLLVESLRTAMLEEVLRSATRPPDLP